MSFCHSFWGKIKQFVTEGETVIIILYQVDSNDMIYVWEQKLTNCILLFDYMIYGRN